MSISNICNMNPRASISVLLLLLVVTASHASPLSRNKPELVTKRAAKPEHVDITTQILTTNKGSTQKLLEGDLLIPNTKNALNCLSSDCFWKKNSSNVVVVPYNISSDFSATNKTYIENAMTTFHNKTCIRFVPRTNQTDYISIESLSGCYSYLGRIGGKQVASLSKTGCLYSGIIQHELNHALGFYHEQTRSDRDQYVKINWQYIPTDKAYNFEKKDTNNQNTPYDYGSIMHYGRTAFTTQAGKETITPIPDATVQIGQRQDLSNIDILRINKLYGCQV